jgi:hypothetical protein
VKKILIISISIVLFSSCFRDDYDFNDISGELTPTYAVPLASASIKTLDVLNALDSTALSAGENGLLSLVYSDTLVSITLADIISIPTQTLFYAAPVSEPIDLDDVAFEGFISLGNASDNFTEPTKSFLQSSDGQEVVVPGSGIQDAGIYNAGSFPDFENITFSSGTLSTTMTNGWPVDVDNFKVALINKNSGTPIDTLDFGYLAAGQTKTVVSQIGGKTIEKEIDLSMFSIELIGTAPNTVTVDLSDAISFEVEISNAKIVAGSAIIPSQEVFRDTTNFEFMFNNGEEIERVLLKDGAIQYSVDYELLESSNLDIIIPAASKNGVSFSNRISIVSDNVNPVNKSGTFDLSGYELDLTKSGSTFNEMDVYIVASVVSSGNSVQFDTSNRIIVDFDFENIEIQEVEGYFGNQTISIAQDTAEVDLNDNELLNHFEFINPQVRIFIDNSFGIPINIDPLSFIFNGDNQSIALTGVPSPFQINYPNLLGSSVATELNINNQTTNIADAINAGPKEVVISGNAEVNPSGRVNNFALDQSKLNIRVDVDVPLYAFVRDYSVRDTIDIDLQEILENLESAKLRSIVTNDFPIEGAVQMYFTDENYVILDSVGDLSSNVIEPAPTDMEGNTTGSTKNISDFELSSEKMNRLETAKHIIIITTINTPQSGTVPGRIYETFEIDVKLSLLAQVKVQL